MIVAALTANPICLLCAHGRFGDSFDDILNGLMDVVEGKAKK
jgi:hypothetical protein